MIALLYIYVSKQRIIQLISKQEHHLISSTDLSSTFIKMRVMNKSVNATTSKILACFYFMAVALISGITFSLVKFKLDIFVVVLLINILLILTMMLVFYVKSSIDLTTYSRKLMRLARFSVKRKKWRHKFWTGATNLKIWIGHMFALEESDLLLKIFGQYVITNVA